MGRADEGAIRRLAVKAAEQVAALANSESPHIEQIQDIVEETLATGGFPDVAKAYILYRQERAALRAKKQLLGVRDDLKLPLNALRVLHRRYLLRDAEGNVAETPSELFRRVARAVAAPDANYPEAARLSETEETFYELMARGDFLPNSPTLMNAGTPLGQLSACFVLPIEDSLRGIFETLKLAALVQQSGGGVGYSFSRLRPRGDLVRSTGGRASGPVSFLRVYDLAAEVVRQGGRRRGAQMGVLRVDHPDIVEFVSAKAREGVLRNFNLSVGVTDAFMQAVEQDLEYELVHPRTGKCVTRRRARGIWDLIVANAWASAEPGLLFLDEIERHNPTPALGKIEATNPCGELPLLPYEACTLGSVNLARMVKNGALDAEKLRRTVHHAVHFLDNVVEAGRFPAPEIAAAVRTTRKIGLGVMGFADALIAMGIPYDSEEALAVARQIMSLIQTEAVARSVTLGKTRGSFPAFAESAWQQRGYPTMRNATVTAIAPTGTISLLAGVSSGIEPLFAVAYARRALEGVRLLETHPEFERRARQGVGNGRPFWSDALLSEIGRRGSVRGLPDVPEEIQRLFGTALDIEPSWHVRMQAAFQEYTDNGVSKTINLPENAAIADVDAAYRLAYRLRCKGITVYRYGSRKEQVLTLGLPEPTPEAEPFVTVEEEYTGECVPGHCY